MTANGVPRPSDPAVVLWEAQRVVDQHRTPPEPYGWRPGCARCTDDGCELLVWAETVLAERDR